MNTITKFAVTGLAVLGLSLGVASKAEAKHTVQAGDTLSKIAYSYGTSVGEIAKANPQIANINLIYVGDIINGVGEGNAQPAKTSYVNTVQAPQPKQYVAPQPQAKTYVAPKKQYVAPAPQKKQYVAPKKNYVSNVSGSEAEAKEWIAQKESGGSYSAMSKSGKFVGRYQLTNTYLNGDYSPANQERVASKYISERYQTWTNAKAFWEKNGFY